MHTQHIFHREQNYQISRTQNLQCLFVVTGKKEKKKVSDNTQTKKDKQ